MCELVQCFSTVFSLNGLSVRAPESVYCSSSSVVSGEYVLHEIPNASRVKTEEIREGRISAGVQGYLEGMFRESDPYLTKIPGKT